jgi:glucose-1-phosphate adenylyltransferase
MRVDRSGRIVRFVEKPKEERVLDDLALDEETIRELGLEAQAGMCLASMGIYTFRWEVLERLLGASAAADFGRDLIPSAIHDHRVFSFVHSGYWRDIGTIPSFHEASLDLTKPLPPLNLYDPSFPVYTHARYLPGTKINRCQVEQSILCEGSIISESRISNSIVGIRAIVREGTTIENSIVMGARYFESQVGRMHDVPMAIGRNCTIRNAIVDLNARIGAGSVLVNEKGVQEADGEDWCIRGGIVVVPRDAVIPPGTRV